MKNRCLLGYHAWAVLVAALAVTGCTVPTYINIPAESADVAFGNPNAGDVREIVEVAVSFALESDPIGGPYHLVLPDGTTPATYAMVTYQLGGDALVPTNVPAVALDEDGKPIKTEEPLPEISEPLSLGDFPAIEVKSIRIRSGKGQVELIRPTPTGRRLVTVYLVWDAGHGWAGDSLRVWRIDPYAQPEPIGPAAQRSPDASS